MNKFSSRLLFSLFSLGLFLIFPTGIKASDQTITCNSAGCSGLSAPLFNETNIAPGNSITRTLHVINSDNPDSCNFTMSATTPQVIGRPGSDDFTSRLFTVIKDGGSDVYGVRDGADKATNTKTLANLSGDTPIYLGSIDARRSRDYNWTVYFEKDSGNVYQEATAKFDLSLTFACGNAPAETSTPSPASNTSASGASSNAPTPTPIPGILGAFTKIFQPEPTTESSPSPFLAPQILGTECIKNKFPWWIFLVLQLLSSILIIRRARINKWKFIKTIIFLAAVAILSQVAHELIGCNCITSFWCPKYLWINIAILLLSTASFLI
jgi:hypothetical protein